MGKSAWSMVSMSKKATVAAAFDGLALEAGWVPVFREVSWIPLTCLQC